MNRTEFVRLAVLLSIADHYEDVAFIDRSIAEDLEPYGVEVTEEEIRRSLIALVETGLARAYWLWGPGPNEEIQGVPPLEHFQEYYFGITEEGLRVLPVWRKAWPLDDEGELLPGWAPPDEWGSKGTA